MPKGGRGQEKPGRTSPAILILAKSYSKARNKGILMSSQRPKGARTVERGGISQIIGLISPVDCIPQGILLVLTIKQKLHGFSVQLLINLCPQ